MKQCLECCEKHLAVAEAVELEVHSGYQEDFNVVIGQLTCAEMHTIKQWPELAAKIRITRLNFADGHEPGLPGWIDWQDLWESWQTAWNRELQMTVQETEEAGKKLEK